MALGGFRLAGKLPSDSRKPKHDEECPGCVHIGPASEYEASQQPQSDTPVESKPKRGRPSKENQMPQVLPFATSESAAMAPASPKRDLAQRKQEACARQAHQVADVEEKTLALTESAFEEIESLKETVVALEARISAQDEVRRETEDAWESRIREMQEHHEKKIRELDMRTNQEQLEMRSWQLEERERQQQAQETNQLQREMLEQQMEAMREALKAKHDGHLRAHVRMYSHRGVGTFTSAFEEDPRERKIFEAARALSRAAVPRPVRPSALEPAGSYGPVHRPRHVHTVA